MSNKLTIVKILSKGDDFSITQDDIERWRQIFADKKMTLEEATATGEVEVQTLPVMVEGEEYITLVKLGDENYKPTLDDLKNWREIFEEAKNDPDFKIFTHPMVEIEVIPIGKIIEVE